MTFTMQVVLVALGTYVMRASVILISAGREIPERVQSTLRLIPAAVLPALVANALVRGAAVRSLVRGAGVGHGRGGAHPFGRVDPRCGHGSRVGPQRHLVTSGS